MTHGTTIIGTIGIDHITIATTIGDHHIIAGTGGDHITVIVIGILIVGAIGTVTMTAIGMATGMVHTIISTTTIIIMIGIITTIVGGIEAEVLPVLQITTIEATIQTLFQHVMATELQQAQMFSQATDIQMLTEAPNIQATELLLIIHQLQNRNVTTEVIQM